MSLTYQRLLLGMLGGMTPVFAELAANDFRALIDNNEITIGFVIGYILKIVFLSAIGATVAWIHSDIKNRLVLFQLGVAAPALISALVNETPKSIENRRESRSAQATMGMSDPTTGKQALFRDIMAGLMTPPSLFGSAAANSISPFDSEMLSVRELAERAVVIAQASVENSNQAKTEAQAATALAQDTLTSIRRLSSEYETRLQMLVQQAVSSASYVSSQREQVVDIANQMSGAEQRARDLANRLDGLVQSTRLAESALARQYSQLTTVASDVGRITRESPYAVPRAGARLVPVGQPQRFANVGGIGDSFTVVALAGRNPPIPGCTIQFGSSVEVLDRSNGITTNPGERTFRLNINERVAIALRQPAGSFGGWIGVEGVTNGACMVSFSATTSLS